MQGIRESRLFVTCVPMSPLHSWEERTLTIPFAFLKQVLFDSDPTHEARLESLATVIPSLEAHTTITRAWALHQRHVRLAHEGEMARKYDSMVSAINLLEKVDRTLWDKSVGGKKFQNVDQRENTNARLEGMVPREMRIPVEVPGDNMWDGNWTAPGKVEPVVKK